ncbi:MAG: hypothetical protein GXO30_07675 [Epsilonproteobacteria bacterium]|nr:hypothetical protein [Campylobacterota bacterium]
MKLTIEPNKAQSYKQIGNSVSVPLIKKMAQNINDKMFQ